MHACELSLYVHVPFCTTKCGYCDFYSVPITGRATGRLVRALITEMRCRIELLRHAVVTIFVGGGTPTVLSPEELARLLAAIREAAGDRPAREFTVEANPDTLDLAKAQILHRAGVNRLSLGAQSFRPADLQVLDRLHDPASVARSVRTARSAGFEQINLDLIFGIPGQTMAAWRDSLRRAAELEPTHLACYGLTYEPGTPLTARRDRGRVRPCDEALEAEMFGTAIDELASAGFEHYEISNYALPGCRCEHNLRYWRNEPYLGIGPSAASFVGGRRWRNVPDLDRYVAAVEQGARPEVESETLRPLAAIRETAMLALRMRDGIDVAAMRERFGADPLRLFAPLIERLRGNGLLLADQRAIRLTRRGLLFADSVAAEFLGGEVHTAEAASLEARAALRPDAIASVVP